MLMHTLEQIRINLLKRHATMELSQRPELMKDLYDYETKRQERLRDCTVPPRRLTGRGFLWGAES